MIQSNINWSQLNWHKLMYISFQCAKPSVRADIYEERDSTALLSDMLKELHVLHSKNPSKFIKFFFQILGDTPH